MIRLEKPYLRKEENRVFLCAPITLEGKRQEAWFSTEPEYGQYLTDDRLDAFVVGFGLDFNEKYRNLPYVGILKPEAYEK